MQRQDDPLDLHKPNSAARAQSDPTSNNRRVSFGDVTFRRIPTRPGSQTNPEQPHPVTRRHSYSVSWNTTVEVFIVPARKCKHDVESFTRIASVPAKERARDVESFTRIASVPAKECAPDVASFTCTANAPANERTRDVESFTRTANAPVKERTRDCFARRAIVPANERARDVDCVDRKALLIQEETNAEFCISPMTAPMKARITHGARRVSSDTTTDARNVGDCKGDAFTDLVADMKI
ncbi:hypothetical protein T484DRAFT_1756178 [Baffinella frigidus]|nr:hypothetical protein T484DRAFT_1756178 [Cryptophyta sp. CCMP2293]